MCILQLILNPIATAGLIVTSVKAKNIEGLNLAIVIITSVFLFISLSVGFVSISDEADRLDKER